MTGNMSRYGSVKTNDVHFSQSPIKSRWFCVLPPPFEQSLFLVGVYFVVDVYFGKYGIHYTRLSNYLFLTP